MIAYINRGFIAEQAVAEVFRRYFDRLNYDGIYDNFHLTVTNEHPFAHLIIHPDSANTADIFPAITVTTQSDEKVPEMSNMFQQVAEMEFSMADIDGFMNYRRQKFVIGADGEKNFLTDKNGEPLYETIPGYCLVVDEGKIARLRECAEKHDLYGVSISTRRRDHVSAEIWAENNQLKNEIYEHLRLFADGYFIPALNELYAPFNPVVPGSTIRGERSNNYNFDFDVPLYGANIAFDIDYNVEQIVIDTDITDTKNITLEVKNHVKEN
jgi:hypothetical protein